MKKIYLFAVLVIFFSTKTFSEQLPDFTAKTLKNKNFTLSKNLKKGAVINFWATWCVPCMAEMQELKKIYPQFKEKINFISISVDDARSISKVTSYVKGQGLPFTVLTDANKNVYNKLHIANVPTLIIIDSNKEVLLRHEGYSKGDEKEVKEILTKICGDENSEK